MTDSSGAIRARYDYAPYGRQTKVSGDMDADFGYAGYYYDAADKLCLTLYRAYDPSTGRWLSRDPIGELGGLNLFAYVGGDPVNFVDPLGLLAPNPKFGDIAIESDLAEEGGAAVAESGPPGWLAAGALLGGAAVGTAIDHATGFSDWLANKLVPDPDTSPLPLPAGHRGPPGKPPKCSGRSSPPFGPGDNEGAARGREAHKWWRPPSGFRTGFRFNNGLRPDAINFDTRQILELKTSEAEVKAGREQLANYIRAAEQQFGGTWSGEVVDQSGQPW